MYYSYALDVYTPSTGQLERVEATDPYSQSLAADGLKTQIVDLDAEELKPEGWDSLAQQEKPTLYSHEDIVAYELHVRDFSAGDPTCPAEARGKFVAFCEDATTGVQHLKKLAQAGITHVHLLPSFDFATVPERPEDQMAPDEKLLGSLGPDSDGQQVLLGAVADKDAYNWGYDPVHWGVPEGSYATDPDGSCRVLEFRRMVQALNRMGLRVVLDVVYTHTFASGPHSRYSVLDKIVPGYYLRMSEYGHVEASCVANNTASERAMCGRLIRDDLVHWCRDFKVDGFRFDLMGHLMLDTALGARDDLNMLTLDRDGVNGKEVYMYGEGWDFGEVAGNARGKNACQANLAGTSIGSFNDRFRDAAMGGSPFSDPRSHGFLTGAGWADRRGRWVYNAPSERHAQPLRDEVEGSQAWDQSVRFKLGLAGNLRSFEVPTPEGPRRGESIPCGGPELPVAYAWDPVETVNYVACHDNQTLFDMLCMKLGSQLPLQMLCRLNHVAVASVALAQGVPFFHAGDELLRSKSLDRDSYNSGDWFNALDFSGERHRFGAGLPPKAKNGPWWPLMRPLLADVENRVPWKEVGAGLQLHPVLAASNDPVVRTCVVGAGLGLVVPPFTAAVFVEPRPEPPGWHEGGRAP